MTVPVVLTAVAQSRLELSCVRRPGLYPTLGSCVKGVRGSRSPCAAQPHLIRCATWHFAQSGVRALSPILDGLCKSDLMVALVQATTLRAARDNCEGAPKPHPSPSLSARWLSVLAKETVHASPSTALRSRMRCLLTDLTH